MLRLCNVCLVKWCGLLSGLLGVVVLVLRRCCGVVLCVCWVCCCRDIVSGLCGNV